MVQTGGTKNGVLLPSILAALFSVTSAHAIVILTVPIGNPGNTADVRYIDSDHPSVGSVAQAFNIGKTEVTNAQYVQFLNSVAGADPYGLYATEMGIWPAPQKLIQML